METTYKTAECITNIRPINLKLNKENRNIVDRLMKSLKTPSQQFSNIVIKKVK